MPKTGPFDNYSNEYDNWFVINKYVFQSELNAIRIVQNVLVGYGKGSFVVIKAHKI